MMRCWFPHLIASSTPSLTAGAPPSTEVIGSSFFTAIPIRSHLLFLIDDTKIELTGLIKSTLHNLTLEGPSPKGLNFKAQWSTTITRTPCETPRLSTCGKKKPNMTGDDDGSILKRKERGKVENLLWMTRQEKGMQNIEFNSYKFVRKIQKASLIIGGFTPWWQVSLFIFFASRFTWSLKSIYSKHSP